MLKLGGVPIGPNNYRSPIGVLRSDAQTSDEGIPGSDPDYLIEHHMQAYGIDYCVLTGSGILGISVGTDPDFSNAISTAYNQNLADRWLNTSSRFLGSILINHSDPQYAAKEIDRVAKDRRFVQVLMGSGSRIPFGQRFYHPIYEAAERNGLPVAFHPGSEGAGISEAPTPAGYPTRYFEWHNILPTNYMAQVNSLVCEGVFEKFPGLKVVAIEGGISWLPHLMWRMDKNYKALRSTTPWLKRMPSEYILDHIRFTTQPIEEPQKPRHLEQMFEMVDAQKTVMFSSDYPHWDNDAPDQVLRFLKGDTRERIYWKNAVELYGLDLPVFRNGKKEICHV